ncbi:MAG: hypothetical protein R2867_17670 [Caldilineaceae bacterium]
MNERQIYVPPGGPPRVAAPDPAIYGAMGEANIFAMLEDFYLELEQSPLRAMFPKTWSRPHKNRRPFLWGYWVARRSTMNATAIP